MEAVDSLRVVMFFVGSCDVTPAISVPPSTEVVPPAQNSYSPLSFLFLLSFPFIFHKLHSIWHSESSTVCLYVYLRLCYFDAMSNIF